MTGTGCNKSTRSSTDFLSASGREPGGVNNLRLVSKPSDQSPPSSDDNDRYNPSLGIAIGGILSIPLWVLIYLTVRRIL